jgi:hypothetical protein
MKGRLPRSREARTNEERIAAQEETTRVAMQTLEQERQLRAMKTERLRRAREARAQSPIPSRYLDDMGSTSAGSQ